ncbi:hypothetical protein V6N13_059105 [Hibiscus sabdariffa]|uniref:Uncharacterized protein n=1 Tax=Hibiscus sabdariffa TaxID=183260 RepID=A0ABR2GEG5_9ROSI
MPTSSYTVTLHHSSYLSWTSLTLYFTLALPSLSSRNTFSQKREIQKPCARDASMDTCKGGSGDHWNSFDPFDCLYVCGVSVKTVKASLLAKTELLLLGLKFFKRGLLDFTSLI